MKIRNDLVSIKIGDKQYDFNNLILDEYLRAFAESQLSTEKANQINNSKELTCLLIKFDTPLQNLNEKSVLVNENFDVCAFSKITTEQEASNNKITTQYKYEIDKVLSYTSSNFAQPIDISEYYGKKITALGFNVFRSKSTSIYTNVKAVLDTSNYNIYLQENQNFTITRKDIITADALFYSNDVNKVPAPLHLMPVNNKAVIEPNIIYNSDKTLWITGSDVSFSTIHSIGLSSFIDKIDKEFIIGQDVEIVENGTKLAINNIENLLSKYKTYLTSDLYLNSNLYPSKAEYEYLIVKYKVWQNILSGTYDNPVYTMTDTRYYYHEAIPIANLKGKLNLEINYERG